MKSDAIFLAALDKAIKALDELDELIDTNPSRQSEVDLELTDWLHKLQHEELNDNQLVNISKKIKELRIIREHLRNEFTLITEFNKYRNRISEKTNRKFLVGNIEKCVKNLNQPYRNRVLDDKTMKSILNATTEKKEKQRKQYTYTDKNKIIEMLTNGMKAKEVANELGCSVSTVYYVHRDLVKEGVL